MYRALYPRTAVLFSPSCNTFNATRFIQSRSRFQAARHVSTRMQSFLKKSSSADDWIYGKPSMTMQQFHTHFQEEFDELYKLADGTFNTYGMSLSTFLRKARQFVSHLETHHTIEETYIFPILAKKLAAFKPEAKHIESHRQIHEGLDRLTSLLDSVRAAPSSYSPTAFRETLDSFRTVLFAHLDQEVRDLSPDEFRKYFTIEEMAEIPM